MTFESPASYFERRGRHRIRRETLGQERAILILHQLTIASPKARLLARPSTLSGSVREAAFQSLMS